MYSMSFGTPFKKVLFVFAMLLLFALLADCQEMPLVYSSDKMEHDVEKGTVEWQGNVHLVYGKIDLRADYVKFDLNSKELHANGSVVLHERFEDMFSEEMKYNLEEETGTAKKIRTFQKPWYISAEAFKKTTPNEYLLEGGSFTTCDLANPHYRFTAKRLTVYPGDHFVAYHVVLRFRKVPLLYLPVYRKSLKDNPSGLVLYPGYSSEEGFFILSHYNWHLSERFNGRWYADYFGRRGFGKGVDVNFNYGVEHPGWGYLYAYHIDEKEAPAKGKLSEERWKIHLRHRQKITENITEMVRIDKLSDADFNRDYLYEEVLHFLSRAELENQRPEGSLSITANMPAYTSSVYIRKRINSFTNITENLPRISFDLVSDSIPGTSFYYDLDAGFAYLQKEVTSIVNSSSENEEEGEEKEPVEITEDKKVMQFGLHPELSYQTRIGWLRANPGLGLDGYWYSKDKLDEENIFQGSYECRLPVTMANGIWKNFDTENWETIRKVRHSIYPKFTYYYKPEPDEERDNIYDFCDLLSGEESLVRVELINLVEGKKTSGKIHEMLRLELSSLYDLIAEDEPWTNVAADMKISSLKDISWRTRASYNIYMDILESLDTTLTVEKENWGFMAGARFYNPGGEEHTFDVLGKVKVPLGRKWRVDMQGCYDLNGEDFKVRRVSLYRDLHCWEAQLFWQSEKDGDEEDMRIFVAFKIKAVPGLSLKTPVSEFFWGE